jgi:hypothetical protein
MPAPNETTAAWRALTAGGVPLAASEGTLWDAPPIPGAPRVLSHPTLLDELAYRAVNEVLADVAEALRQNPCELLCALRSGVRAQTP